MIVGLVLQLRIESRFAAVALTWRFYGIPFVAHGYQNGHARLWY